MIRIATAALLWLGLAGLVEAQQPAAPLGLEIGKATCADLLRAAGKPPASDTDQVSVWARGPIVQLQDVGRFELEGLEEVTAICDAQQRIVLLDLRLSKGGMPATYVQSTATQLDRKYKAVRRNLPFVGNGSAEWRAPNAVIEIEAPHMSFSFALRYWAPGGRELYRKWEEAERRQREQKKAGSL